MLDISYSKRFKKNFKKYKNNKVIRKELAIVIDLLVARKPLPSKYKDHELKGNKKGIRELHLAFDDLLLYIIIDDDNLLKLYDIGTHSTTLNI
ncbi:type II toxin-antitoxin system mRNA interferase toxin, RelE/StbE family [Francisella philomiragia]|uniref:type II toxin-antitoxin system mRNA interferase toxin, RelE/StbE family n=1 Tax=Francisella philomiragia TaxID=28110 RepID=UPI00351950C1